MPLRLDSQATWALAKSDEEGRRVLAPLSGFQWVGAFMAAGLGSVEVPAEHWTADEDGGGFVVVRCLCGEAPHAWAAAYPTRCGCGRWFFYDGTTVLSLGATPRRGGVD